MSNERQLLIKDLSINAVDGFFYITQKLQSEIRELLTQPEQSSTTRHALDSYWNQEAYQRGYARAELDLKRESLSDKDIGKGFLLATGWHRYECFIAGVKWAEKMHGIGEDDE
jgi:hypothetical protein